MITPTAPADPERIRWDATVRELVQLRREEAAQDEAAEDAVADELRRVLRDQQPPPGGAEHRPAGHT